MLTSAELKNHVKRMETGNRYSAAEVYHHLEHTPPEVDKPDAISEWAKMYVLSAYAMNGPFTLAGDRDAVQDHLELLYDLLVDKGWFDSLTEARIYADALRRDGSIVVWKEEAGRSTSVYADIATRVPLYAKRTSDWSPVRYMSGITDRVKGYVADEPAKVVGGVVVAITGLWLLAKLFEKKE
jgi:hypothetical protein